MRAKVKAILAGKMLAGMKRKRVSMMSHPFHGAHDVIIRREFPDSHLESQSNLA
jgi:hypothetical protein